MTVGARIEELTDRIAKEGESADLLCSGRSSQVLGKYAEAART
jgi:hypothetical protein